MFFWSEVTCTGHNPLAGPPGWSQLPLATTIPQGLLFPTLPTCVDRYKGRGRGLSRGRRFLQIEVKTSRVRPKTG